MHDLNSARRTGRIIAYIIPVLILILFLFRERAPFGGKNTSFAVSPEKEITRIDLSAGSKKVILIKKGDEWQVNDKYEARKSQVLYMLKILKGIKIKSPVSGQFFKKEIIGKGIAPVKIRVFEGRRLLKSYLVYITSTNAFGNIMKMQNGTKPFIVYVPGMETDIGTSFSADELFWLPNMIFNLLPSEISKITLINRIDPNSSFSVGIANGVITLTDLNKNVEGWDSSRVKRYISYFTHIPFESAATGLSPEERERIEEKDPFINLNVEKTDGEKITLLLWERWNDENGKLKMDTDRLWAKINDRKDLFVVRYMDIDPVLKKRSYFFP